MGAGRSLWRPHGQRSPALLLAVLVFTCLALSATAPGGALLLGAGSCSGMSIIHVKLAASDVSYFSDGVQAALAQDSSVTVNDVVSSPSSVCSSSTLFIFGIRQSSGMADALDTSKACANNVMNIGSFTEGMTYRVWNPLSYFTQSDDFIQSALSVRYAVTELRLRRLALLNVAAYGTDGNDMQAAYLKSAGYAESTEYVKIDTSSSGAYNTFQSFNAQAAMLLDYDNTFVSKLLKDSTQGSIVMFTGSYSTSTLMSQITSNLAYSAQKLFIAFPNQMASETSLNYIKVFNSQFSAANRESLSATDPVQQLLSVAGWLVGTMAVSIFQAMDKSGFACNPAGLQNYLLGSGAVRTWTVGTDYVLGGYSGECASGSSGAANSGCSCNQGGRTAWLYQVTLASSAPSTTRSPRRRGTRACPSLSPCYMEAADLPTPLLITVLESSGSSLDLSGITDLGTLGKSMVSSMGYIPRTESRGAIQLVVNSMTSTSDTDVTTTAQNTKMSVVTGIASQTVQLIAFCSSVLLGRAKRWISLQHSDVPRVSNLPTSDVLRIGYPH
eukprot:gene11459-biopygen8322